MDPFPSNSISLTKQTKWSDRKEQIEKQEEKERLEKEKEEKLMKEAENESDQDKTEDEKKAESITADHSDTINDDVTGNVKDSTEQGPEEVASEVMNGDESNKAEASTRNAVEPSEEGNNEVTDASESISDNENKVV